MSFELTELRNAVLKMIKKDADQTAIAAVIDGMIAIAKIEGAQDQLRKQIEDLKVTKHE